MFKRKNKVKDVEKYYDEWTSRYLDSYGNIIQAYRPPDDEDLFKYLIDRSGLQAGERVLDAGCGVGGPAIGLAQRLDIKIDGITISGEQAAIAGESIKEAGLEDRITIAKGDYHKLDELFPENTFDRVLFLESLGHAAKPEEVIAGAFKVLKPGGQIYIKDFYQREVYDKQYARRIQKIVDNINKHYTYNVLDLHVVISALRRSGFKLVYIMPLQFETDIAIRSKFEDVNQIDLFEGEQEFIPAEWMEIRCLKPTDWY